jgi:hypothetical protein
MQTVIVIAFSKSSYHSAARLLTVLIALMAAQSSSSFMDQPFE